MPKQQWHNEGGGGKGLLGLSPPPPPPTHTPLLRVPGYTTARQNVLLMNYPIHVKALSVLYTITVMF